MADQPGSFSQAEIDALMAGAGGGSADPTPTPAAAAAPTAATPDLSTDDLASIARQAEAAIEAITTAPVPTSAPVASMAAAGGAARTIRGGGLPGPETTPSSFSAPNFNAASMASHDDEALDLLDDVELDIRIELGRTSMYVDDVLKLDVDSVIELDKLAGDPVDIYVNDQLIARGEVLVLNENFCVRINDILSPVPELSGDA